MSRHPTTKWAQRSDKVYITIDLPDAKDVKLSLLPDGHFSFSAIAGSNLSYEVELELYENVNVEESKTAIGKRNVVYIVKKAESNWWPRLLKQVGKPPFFVKVDWDKWVDEEEENKFGGDDMDFGNMDFSNLNMGGGDVPDMGGEDDDEEDDDEMEDIKEAEAPSASAEAAGETEAHA